jgi:hypothetical protein
MAARADWRRAASVGERVPFLARCRDDLLPLRAHHRPGQRFSQRFPGHLQASLQATASWRVRVRVLRVSFMRPLQLSRCRQRGARAVAEHMCGAAGGIVAGAESMPVVDMWVFNVNVDGAIHLGWQNNHAMPNVFAREHKALSRETVQGQRNRSTVTGRPRRPCAGTRITVASPAGPSCLPSRPTSPRRHGPPTALP